MYPQRGVFDLGQMGTESGANRTVDRPDSTVVNQGVRAFLVIGATTRTVARWLDPSAG